MNGQAQPLLEIRQLAVEYVGPRGATHALDGVELALEPAGALGIVGESGSGKSTLLLAASGLLPRNTRVSGSLRFAGLELARASEAELCALRGREIGLVFQEPHSALNPLVRVGAQVAEPLVIHGVCSRQAALERARDLLGVVGLSEPEQVARRFPHELSGGMRQRVLIAMAVACRPRLLLADEPTSALDGIMRAQILALFRELQSRFALALVIVTHDLTLLRGHVERVAVLYAGRVVEEAPAAALFAEPRHPYSALLLAARATHAVHGAKLAAIVGQAPGASASGAGCAFAPRCPLARERCRRETPAASADSSPGRRAACFYPDEAAALLRPNPSAAR
jgi:oligopeptide/dipeptide ABC transporter ATP-binding protein